MTDLRPAAREYRLIVAGSGGQGILTLGKLICGAALSEGWHVAYLPSYGAEVRGGTARCQVTISAEAIYSPLVERADYLVMLNQPSYDRFASALKPDGLLLLNSSALATDVEPPPPPARLFQIPAAGLAAEMGSVKVANVILLGALVTLTGLVGRDACLGELRDLLGMRKPDLLELNLQAFDRGAELASAALGGGSSLPAARRAAPPGAP